MKDNNQNISVDPDTGAVLIDKPKPKNWKTETIGNLLKEELVKGKLINWPKELKILNRLAKTYPSPEFWTSLDLGYKLNSLAFLISERGRQTLFEKHNKHCFSKSLDNPAAEVYDLEDKKIGEDKIIVKKPKSLMEFLKEKNI